MLRSAQVYNAQHGTATHTRQAYGRTRNMVRKELRMQQSGHHAHNAETYRHGRTTSVGRAGRTLRMTLGKQRPGHPTGRIGRTYWQWQPGLTKKRQDTELATIHIYTGHTVVLVIS